MWRRVEKQRLAEQAAREVKELRVKNKKCAQKSKVHKSVGL